MLAAASRRPLRPTATGGASRFRLARPGGLGPGVEGRLEPLGEEALPYPFDCPDAGAQGGDDAPVGPAPPPGRRRPAGGCGRGSAGGPRPCPPRPAVVTQPATPRPR